MTTTAEALVAVIAADAACQTHLGAAAARLYPLTVEQGSAYPAATYQQVAGTHVDSFDGIDTLNNPLIQVDCYAATLKAARDVAKAVRDAVDANAGLGAVVVSEREDFEADIDPRLFKVSLDLSLWHVET